MPTPWRLRSLAVLAVMTPVLVLGGFTATGAQAAPGDLERVRNQVMDLEAKAESANERYNEASGRLADINRSLVALRKKAAQERRRLNGVLDSVDQLARSTYASGGVDTSLQVLLADDPAEFLAQAAALDQVAQANAASLRRTQTSRLRLAQTEAALAQKQAAARKVKGEMNDARREADARLADARRVRRAPAAQERQRLAAEEARQRRADAADAAAAAAALGKGGRGGAGGSGGGGFSGGSRAMAAVRYALSQVGDRYVAAASGPSSFDCSGLTLAAWRQAGVSLPHYSYAQYRKVRRIPLSQIQPGDLLFFFGGSVHHVGIYVGNGKMVHAANPRYGVVMSKISDPWYRRYFSGAGRVVG